MKRKHKAFLSLSLCLFFLLTQFHVVKAGSTTVYDKTSETGNISASWPSKFYPYAKKDGSFIYDPYEGYNPGVDLVSSSTLTKGVAGSLPSVYAASDGSNLFFRLRLDADPRDASAGGFTTSVWQLVIAAEDINNNSSSYGKFVQRVTIGIDGKSPSSDYVYITDGNETNVYQLFSAVGAKGSQTVPGTRVTPADGNGPCFLDIQIPIKYITEFEKTAMGLSNPITGDTPIKLYFGTTMAGSISTINKDWMNGSSVNFDDLSTVTLNSMSQALASIAIDGGSSRTVSTRTPVISGTSTAPDGSDVTVTINGKTYHGTVNNGVWSINVTDELPNGSYTVTAKLSANVDGSLAATQNLNVALANNIPTANSGALSLAEDTTKAGTLTGTDLDPGTTLTYFLDTAPSHGVVSINPNGSYSYTPNTDFNGTDSFTFKAYDGIAYSQPAAISINVSSVNDNPKTSDYNVSTAYNTSISGTVSGSDVDGDSLAYTLDEGNLPSNGTAIIDPESGAWQYKPNSEFSGADSFKVIVSDGNGGQAISTIKITVGAPPHVNSKPTAISTSFDMNENTALSNQLSAEDLDEDLLSYALETGPLHGALILNSDGSFTYTPDKDFVGNDSFTFIVNDGTENSSPATVNIAVKNVNAAPTTQDYLANTSINKAAYGVVAGKDEDKDSLSYEITTAASNGKAIIDKTTGNWTYIPNSSFSGQDSFKVTISDGNGGTVISNVVINVASTLSLAGRVYDQETGTLLPNTSIQIKDLNGQVLFTRITDELGEYRIDGINIGNYTATILNDKYSTQNISLEVSGEASKGNDTITKDFKLVNFVISLEANPNTLVADGMHSTTLTSKVTDKNNIPLANVDVVFSAQAGSFPNGNIAKTDSKGIASVVFKSSKIESIDVTNVAVTAVVEDTTRGLKGTDTINMTFEPSSITGIVVDNSSGLPIEGALVEVSKDFDNNGTNDFYSKYVTSKDGKYKIAIPKGNVSYNLSITKPVTIGGQSRLVTFRQQTSVDTVSGSQQQEFSATKTAAGMILFKQSNGTPTTFSDYSKFSIEAYDSAGNPVPSVNTNIFNSDSDKGVFSADGLEKGSSYKFGVNYQLPTGEKLQIGSINVNISSDGEMNLSTALIDPYGTITDSKTNAIISGVNVKLYYANTARNIGAGKTPGSLVNLPKVEGFNPSDNANPQYSDALGKYAYMVFPDSDYYIVAQKDGYKDYVSPTISVEKEIVKHDFSMTPIENVQVAVPPANTTLPVENTPISTKLPQTGSALDFTSLAALGIFMIAGGMIFLLGARRKDK